jgi:hypothetical protein
MALDDSPGNEDIMRKTLLYVLMVAMGACAYARLQQERILNYSIVGSSSNKSPNFGKTIEHIEVQRLMLELGSAPRTTAHIDSMLARSGVSRNDLEELRLIRRTDSQCFLNFTLFSAEDVKKVREVSERHAVSLAADFLARRPEIESVLRSYNAPGVDPKEVLFIVLGCASLDWDGLKICVDKDYRLVESDRPDGDYVPYAEERSTQSREKIYWGSHNDQFGEVKLTSFGDHHSLPRLAFPDFLWRLDSSKPDSGFPAILKASNKGKKEEKSKIAVRQLGDIVFALRDRERTIGELAQSASISEDEATTWLEFLSNLEYVRRDENQYRLKIPVFVKSDRTVINQLKSIGHEIMVSWLQRNYGSIKQELAVTTPSRNGVPYAEGFTMIWHFIFGITNRLLVEAGLFADPYAESRKHKGFVPAVYHEDTM